MKTKLYLIVLPLMCYQLAIAQTASDFLENSKRIKDGENIYFNFSTYTKLLTYHIDKSLPEKSKFTEPFADSMIYLASNKTVNVFLKPLNPLSFTYKINNKIINDPTSEAAEGYMSSMIDILKLIITPMQQLTNAQEVAKKDAEKFLELQDKFISIQDGLKTQKSSIHSVFKSLKSLTFDTQQGTKIVLDKSKNKIASIEKDLHEIDSLIKDAIAFTKKNGLTSYIETDFLTKYTYISFLNDLRMDYQAQQKRLNNLKNAYTLVDTAYKKAEEMGWLFLLEAIKVPDGKISICTISIIESGYKLSNDNEIVPIESKEIVKKTIRIRPYNVFIPEVSTGVIFTTFAYNTYGTTSDGTGQQFVAEPTKNTVKNINITGMINWNIYSRNTSIHPLIQTGVGINAGIPTLILGVGLRFSDNTKSRLRITGGYSMTWLRELNTLSVGSKVSGTAEIEKDFKYSSVPKFRPYAGIQYNF